MRLPTPLSRKNPNAAKYDFGHVFILAGSPSMLGAAALTTLAAMRAGAGLTTLGIPKSLNLTAQKKISHSVMTHPLAETKNHTLSSEAFAKIKQFYPRCNVIAIGPGLSQNPSTQNLIRKVIATSPQPLVIDADGLNALAEHLDILRKTKTPKILTPHSGEMARLTGLSRSTVENNRAKIALDFSHKFSCVLLLKGYHTIVASPDGKFYTNKTGNIGMATAGSGDVLTGIIAAFLAQGLDVFTAAKYGAYVHGKAGDLAARRLSKTSLIATDLIDDLPRAI